MKQEETNTFYGKVVSVRPFIGQESQPSLGGAAVGGVAGGVIGHQFGKGDGKTAMTVLGVLGGAVVGSQVGKTVHQVPMQELTVQMPNGSTFTVNVEVQNGISFQQGQNIKITTKGKKAEIQAI